MIENLKILKNTYYELLAAKYKVLVMGDLNSDFMRKNAYDRLLINTCNELKITILIFWKLFLILVLNLFNIV